MKLKHKTLSAVIAAMILGSAPVAHATEENSRWKPSGGLGFGMLHSGYGINLGMKNNSSFFYASIGCGQYNWLHNCDDRYSFGYFRSGLIGSATNRHALGIYFGQLDRNDTGQATRGIGAGYVYFPSGISERGFTLGLGFEVGETDGHTDHHEFRMQVGVQF